jgi:tetratricopeptide (TPR) repeat protein
MFNNIIYFIVVLLIFNINYPDSATEHHLLVSLGLLFVSWLIFAGYCRWVFRDLQKRLDQGVFPGKDVGSFSGQYQKLITRLSVTAVFLFALAVYLFHLKTWTRLIPLFGLFSVLQGTFALTLFFFYLSTIWYFAYRSYQAIFQSGITRRSFIRSNLRLNIPILFPWIVLSFVYDLIGLSPWFGPDSFLNRAEGQILFFASFLTLLMIFLPMFIQYWWGCKSLNTSEKGRQLEAFLGEKGFKFRKLLTWPVFEGKMMTAGIMGILPRYRYILITDSLVEILSIEELQAVLAHEMGHAKYQHVLFYILFFVGFMGLSFGLFDFFFYVVYANPYFLKMVSSSSSPAINLFSLVLSVPMLMTLLVYFRYIMGFFMRNFERQADLYSAVIMGSPVPAISALEKIALLSGKIRSLPNWHHFSIKDRVECLQKTLTDSDLSRRHNRFLGISFLVYLVCLGALVYLLNFSTLKSSVTYTYIIDSLNQQLLKEPENITVYQSLAMVYQQMGNYPEAIHVYERVIELDPGQAVSLNNLAWLLVTAPDKELRDKSRALVLARKAVALERSPVFLDTLAEACYANGRIQEAIELAKEAIARATEDRGYYERQLAKFLASQNKP